MNTAWLAISRTKSLVTPMRLSFNATISDVSDIFVRRSLLLHLYLLRNNFDEQIIIIFSDGRFKTNQREEVLTLLLRFAVPDKCG